MEIKFLVSKKYNQFFFVQTLAEWHFSCRPEYIERWIKKTGPLTEQEKKALSKFKQVIQKKGFDPIKNCPAANAFDFFMRFDEFDDKSSFSKNDIKRYLDVMKCLEARFNKVWETESKNLEQVEKLLSDRFNQKKVALVSDLNILFELQTDPEINIDVILLLSTEEGGGGANNGPGIVSLECSSIKPENINYLLSTLWHEVSHLILEDYVEETASIMKKNDIIKKASTEAEKIDFDYSKELLSFSIFAPMSFLTQKYFPTDIAKKLSESVARGDEAWLLEARFIFPSYLIYLNGQFIKKMLDENRPVSPLEMANNIVANHKVVLDFFAKHDKVPVWFDYG